MALWAVGAVINVIGSILINLGTNVIKLGHTRTAAVAEGKPPKLLRAPKRWWRTPGNKLWLTGMAAFSVGNLLNFASFAFAAQSLLSALGVVQFISNIIFGRFVNKEKVTKRVVFATAVVCAGCVLLVAFGNHESPTLSTHDLLDLYTHAPYIVYLCFIFTCAPAMYMVYRHGKRAVVADHSGAAAKKWARWLPISYALFAGVLGTQSVLYGKTMSMLLRTTFSGDSQFKHWYMYISIFLFLLFAGFWMSRYSKALKLFPVLVIMPIIQIVWVLFSMISGSLYYQEYKTLTALSGSMFALGVVVLLAGVYLLTGGQTAPQPPRPELKSALSELSEEERGEGLGGAALRPKAPLSDSLGAVAVEVSAAGAAALEPDEALVARKLSTIYEQQPAARLGTAAAAVGGSGVQLAARAASVPPPRGRRWPPLEEGSASEESTSKLVLAGLGDSAAVEGSPWPAAAVTGSEASSWSGAAVAPLSEVVVGDAGQGGNVTTAAGRRQPETEPGALAPPPGLMHDLRTDWAVGVRDLGAVMRASVGLPQDDAEGTAFSIWSMPMCCSASFTAPGRAGSIDLHRSARDTFRPRSALEQQLSGGSSTARAGATDDSVFPPGSARRPGHRRINRSRSANELDDMLRAVALAEEAERASGAVPWVAPGASDSYGVESAWQAASSVTSAAGGAAGLATGEVTSQLYDGAAGGLGVASQHRRHPSASSAPLLSSIAQAGASTPPHMPPASAAIRMPSSAGSAPRRPYASAEAGGLGMSPAASHASQVDESEGPWGGSPLAVQREGGVPASEFLSPGSASLSMSFSPTGSEGNMAATAARVRQQVERKGDKAS